MLRKIVIFLIIFFSAILQLAVFPNVFFWGVGPNILLLLVIFWTTREGFEKALSKNILVGLAFDLVVFCPIGTHVAVFTLVSFFIGFISKRFLVVARNWRIFILAMTIIFSTLASRFFLMSISGIADYFSRAALDNLPISFFISISAKEGVLNILFFPLVYFLLKKIESLNFLKSS